MKCTACGSPLSHPIHQSQFAWYHPFVSTPNRPTCFGYEGGAMPLPPSECGTSTQYPEDDPIERMYREAFAEDDPTVDHEDVVLGGEG